MGEYKLSTEEIYSKIEMALDELEGSVFKEDLYKACDQIKHNYENTGD